MCYCVKVTVLNIPMQSREFLQLQEFNLRFLQPRKPLPGPSKDSNDWQQYADQFETVLGYRVGQIPVSEFVKYDIKNWSRNDDPRLRSVQKTIRSGIREPIRIGQDRSGQVIVSDGGHRVSAAVDLWLRTGKDISVPFYFRPYQN